MQGANAGVRLLKQPNSVSTGWVIVFRAAFAAKPDERCRRSAENQ